MILRRNKKVKKMNCDKFEQLFIQETDDELLAHIRECETCRQEYQKMLKTEQIIKEAKPVFAAKKRNKSLTKIAAGVIAAVLASMILIQQNTNTVYVSKVPYDESIAEIYPVDEYGLLDIY